MKDIQAKEITEFELYLMICLFYSDLLKMRSRWEVIRLKTHLRY